MKEVFTPRNPPREELQVYHYGLEECKNGHHYGPAVRDHYLIHFILSGKGIFKLADTTYTLKAQEAFLIVPNLITYYQADLEDPWTYTWLGFNGDQVPEILLKARLSQDSPIIRYGENSAIPRFMAEMLDEDLNQPGSTLRLKAYLHLVLAELQRVNPQHHTHHSRKTQQELYAEKAIEYMERNYSRQIHVTDIAHFLGLNRSYFSSIFRETLHISPQEYLIRLRMDKAAELLSSTTLTIGDVARSVGYNDPFGFSRVFKSQRGCSPSQFREVMVRVASRK